MDRIAQQTAIHRLLEEYRAWYSDATPPEPDVETMIVSDDEHGQYLLSRVGWRGSHRLSRPVFYLRLKNDKIWIEEDWTEESIASELVHLGIPHSDIVLAFNPPEVRHLTEFAVS